MSAVYMAKFADGQYAYVNSADAKSFKAKDVRASYRKARQKAEKKRPGVKVVDLRCVG